MEVLMSDKISVVIPVYKVEKFLERCLQSVVRQTYNNLEIILVDDGSPDECPKICDNWAIKDNRITVIHKENSGLSGARNAGINIATGKFISFVDSDDIIAPNMIEFLYKSLIDTNSDIAITSMVQFYQETPLFLEKNKILSDCTEKILLEIMYKSSHWEACGKLYKKSLFDYGLKFIEGKLYEDLHFTLRVFAEANKAVFCDNAMYGYYQRNDSIMGKTRVSISKDLIEILQGNINFIEEKYNDNTELYECLFTSFVLQPSIKLEDIERNKSYSNNQAFITEYKKYIKRNWAKIKASKYITKKYKIGFYISMHSVKTYNKIFKLIRYLQKNKLIQWKR